MAAYEGWSRGDIIRAIEEQVPGLVFHNEADGGRLQFRFPCGKCGARCIVSTGPTKAALRSVERLTKAIADTKSVGCDSCSLPDETEEQSE